MRKRQGLERGKRIWDFKSQCLSKMWGCSPIVKWEKIEELLDTASESQSKCQRWASFSLWSTLETSTSLISKPSNSGYLLYRQQLLQAGWGQQQADGPNVSDTPSRKKQGIIAVEMQIRRAQMHSTVEMDIYFAQPKQTITKYLKKRPHPAATFALEGSNKRLFKPDWQWKLYRGCMCQRLLT